MGFTYEYTYQNREYIHNQDYEYYACSVHLLYNQLETKPYTCGKCDCTLSFWAHVWASCLGMLASSMLINHTWTLHGGPVRWDDSFPGQFVQWPTSPVPPFLLTLNQSPKDNARSDSGRFRGCKCTPLWWLVMYFCVHNCTSPSNDYAAVACSNNNLHTHASVPYWSPDVWLGLELLRDIQDFQLF